jgi:hypothetical protein
MHSMAFAMDARDREESMKEVTHKVFNELNIRFSEISAASSA